MRVSQEQHHYKPNNQNKGQAPNANSKVHSPIANTQILVGTHFLTLKETRNDEKYLAYVIYNVLEANVTSIQ